MWLMLNKIKPICRHGVADIEDGRLAPTTPIAALVASGLVLSFSLKLIKLLTVAFAILVGDDVLGLIIV